MSVKLEREMFDHNARNQTYHINISMPHTNCQHRGGRMKIRAPCVHSVDCELLGIPTCSRLRCEAIWVIEQENNPKHTS